MIVVVAVLVLVVLIAVATWAVRRRGVDEAHSVDGYRHTLDTLQGIRSRSTSGSVRVLGGPAGTEPRPPAAEEGAAATGDGAIGPAGSAGEPLGSRPGSGPPSLVFEDPGLAEGAGPLHARTSRRSQDRAMSAMNHRPRRLGASILVAVVVLGLLVLVVEIGEHTRHPPNQKTGSSTTLPATRTTSSPAGSHPGGGGHATTTTGPKTGSKTGTGSKSDSHKATTTTTVPPSFTAVTSTATTATYTPPTATYTVTFTTTTGECWVNATSATGSTLLSETLATGESKSVTATGKMAIIIGAPSVISITIDHKPVVFPSGYQTPFYITLVPATT